MKKTNTMTSDYSKSSFFNDGNNLFCNPPFGLLKFNGYGTFIMKYQNRQFQVSIFLANSWLKIVDEVITIIIKERGKMRKSREHMF